MTSLLGRLLPLFSGPRRVEDLFTEAIARLFERRPDLCLGWLEEAGLLRAGQASVAEGGQVRVSSQRPFVPLDHHDAASRMDLLIEVHRTAPEGSADEATRRRTGCGWSCRWRRSYLTTCSHGWPEVQAKPR